MVTKMNSLRALACCLPMFAFACDKSAADAQKEADKAQSEANTKTTSAQVEADKKIADAKLSFAKTREDYRHDVQSKLDTLDKKIADLDAKAKTATGTAKSKLDANLTSLHTQRDLFAKDFGSIDRDTAATWDSSKMRLDKEWDALKDQASKAD